LLFGLIAVLTFMILFRSQDGAQLSVAMGQAATATALPTDLLPDAALHYQVAFVAENDALNVRAAAGVQATIVDTLQNGDTVQPAGAGQMIDGALWIPIQYNTGKSGWVNRNFLIATQERSAFCDDQRPLALIAALQEAVQHLNSRKFAQLVAPRGLYLALDGDKTLLISPADLQGFFADRTLRNWGRNGNTDGIVSGTLAEKVTPLLQQNLVPRNATVQIACNDNQDDLSERTSLDLITIPGDKIDNFYSVLRPGPPGYDLNWGAWGLAIEYWNGEPVLTGMVYYYWTP
jgi:hypothetical protein